MLVFMGWAGFTSRFKAKDYTMPYEQYPEEFSRYSLEFAPAVRHEFDTLEEAFAHIHNESASGSPNLAGWVIIKGGPSGNSGAWYVFAPGPNIQEWKWNMREL